MFNGGGALVGVGTALAASLDSGVSGGVPFAACIAVERLLALSACGCSGLGLALAAGVNNSVLLALAGSVTFAVCVDRRLALA